MSLNSSTTERCDTASDISVFGRYGSDQLCIQENAVETQTPVNNVDDLIQLQTTESDKMKVTDAEMLFQLQELNKNMKKVDSSIQGLVD